VPNSNYQNTSSAAVIKPGKKDCTSQDADEETYERSDA
jgi:hypothetical protein